MVNLRFRVIGAICRDAFKGLILSPDFVFYVWVSDHGSTVGAEIITNAILRFI